MPPPAHSESPDITLATPCLNPGTRLERALRSVEEQRPPPGGYEHIIADGGSTDGAVDIALAYAARQAERGIRVEVLRGPDAGQSDALNKAFALGRGRFAGWINADDWLEPGALCAAAAALAGGADVVIGRCRFIGDGGRCVWEPRAPDPVTPEALLTLRSGWFAGRSIAQPEAFFRLAAFRRIGGLDPGNHFTMDHDLWVRLAVAGASFIHVDAHWASIGVHEGQKTRDNRAVVRSILATVERELPGLATSSARDIAMREAAGIREKLGVIDALFEWWGSPGSRGVPSVLPPAPVQAVAPLLRGRSWLAAGERDRWRGLPAGEGPEVLIIGAESTVREAHAGLLRARAAILAEEPLDAGRIVDALTLARRRLCDGLTLNDDRILGTAADPFIRRALGRGGPTWPEVDASALRGAGLREVCAFEHGEPAFHPLMPWPAEGASTAASLPAWRASLWER